MSSYLPPRELPYGSDEYPSFGIASAWMGAALIGLTAVSRITLNETITSWAYPLLSIGTWTGVVFTLVSIVYVRHSSTFRLKRNAIPLIINVSTLLIIQFVPFADLWQEVRFLWQRTYLDEIIALVESGQLQPDSSGFAQLPPKYDRLSEDGRILIEQTGERTAVFFFTRYQSHWNYAGYLYSSNNALSLPDFGGHWRTVEQKRPNWFICQSY